MINVHDQMGNGHYIVKYTWNALKRYTGQLWIIVEIKHKLFDLLIPYPLQKMKGYKKSVQGYIKFIFKKKSFFLKGKKCLQSSWHCDITEDSDRHVISGSSSKLMPQSTFICWSNMGFIFLNHYIRTVSGVSSIFKKH